MIGKVLAVAMGGALGALLRFSVQNWSLGRWGALFPYGTLIVNLTGAFFIGFVMTVLLKHVHVSPAWRLFHVTGILGGYTTFSALVWETLHLAQKGHLGFAVLYSMATMAGGLLAAGLGVWLARFA